MYFNYERNLTTLQRHSFVPHHHDTLPLYRHIKEKISKQTSTLDTQLETTSMVQRNSKDWTDITTCTYGGTTAIALAPHPPQVHPSKTDPEPDSRYVRYTYRKRINNPTPRHLASRAIFLVLQYINTGLKLQQDHHAFPPWRLRIIIACASAISSILDIYAAQSYVLQLHTSALTPSPPKREENTACILINTGSISQRTTSLRHQHAVSSKLHPRGRRVGIFM